MNKRRLWFITRPERDPQFHREALEALEKATQGFSVKWKGNRDAHKKYEKELARSDMKRNAVSNDGSGGRTWAAMLRTFAYCYLDSDGFIKVTKSGRRILEGKKVRENIKKQIMTLQIPNAYFMSPGFRPKYEDGFRIRPVKFIIKLCSLDKLDRYVTKEEITYFALKTKNDNELESVAEEILGFRGMSTNKKNRVKAKIAAEYDHRERSDSGARKFETAHADVAHTLMMVAEYTELVEYIRGDALRINSQMIEKTRKELDYYDTRYPFNTRFIISSERMAQSNGLDIDSYKASSYGKIRPATNAGKLMKKALRALNRHPHWKTFSIGEIEEVLGVEMRKSEAEKLALQIKGAADISDSNISQEFMEGYLNEDDNLAFEEKTAEILAQIGFDVKLRPKSTEAGGQTQIEILLKYGDCKCAIIDAKNYSGSFDLTANLVSHMASEYLRIYDNYDSCRVEHFGYIAANKIGGVRNLTKISKIAREKILHRDVKGMMMNARSLLGYLDYCIENDIPKEDRVKKFIQLFDNSAYSDFHEVLKKLDI